MKKYIALLFTVLAFVLTGCEKETEPGGTAVEKMADDWWVTVSVDDDEDPTTVYVMEGFRRTGFPADDF